MTSEISFPAVVNTSDVPYVNVIKTPSEAHSRGNMCTGTNLKLKMEEIKDEVTSETSIPAIVDSASDVPYLNVIKKEFSPSDPHSYGGFVQHVDVKHEDTNSSIESLGLQMKLEVPDLKRAMKSGDNDDDIFIKFEPLMSEDMHIKNEDEESLVDQLIKKSTDDKHFYCGLCNSKFELKRKLQKHLKNHSKAKIFQCNICDYSCKWKSNLRRHLNMHTGDKRFECDICNTFMNRSNLQRHMKTHTGEKLFKCGLCHYKSLRNSNLQEHMKTHTGEKPFKCNVCDYRFTWNYDLQRHIKTHTGEKPFECDICDYKFVQKSSLQQHIKTHTGEKPFQCHMCQYRCIRKGTLQRHMKIHAGGSML